MRTDNISLQYLTEFAQHSEHDKTGDDERTRYFFEINTRNYHGNDFGFVAKRDARLHCVFATTCRVKME